MIGTLLQLGFLTIGTFFMFVAALGIFRMPDVYNMLHTSTKAVTISLVNLLLAAMIDVGSLSVVMKSTLIIVFQFMTAPVAAHMISRIRHPDAWDGTIIDEMIGEPTAGRGSEEPEESVTHEAEGSESEESKL